MNAQLQRLMTAAERHGGSPSISRWDYHVQVVILLGDMAYKFMIPDNGEPYAEFYTVRVFIQREERPDFIGWPHAYVLDEIIKEWNPYENH